LPYKLLPDVALADIAYRAESATVSGLFASCARALTDIMVDPKTLRGKVTKRISLKADDIDGLLYDFLTELIVVKDVDSLLFEEFKVSVAGDGTTMRASLRGEPIDRGRHILRNDVKAVTMHMFGVSHRRGRWAATVVLDI
jgi:SHS2 domain-containing protein